MPQSFSANQIPPANSSGESAVYPCNMLNRVHLPLALVILAGCACSPAQAPKPKAPAPAPPVEIKLPPIVPNVKWTINQNSAQLLLSPEIQKSMGLSSDTKDGIAKVYAAYNVKY